ncbi:MAG TPA: YceI family protein [Ilumatobacteraceae bacterium]
MAITDLTPGKWDVDPTHSAVTFQVRHMMVSKVRGSFHDFHADVNIAPDPLRSKVTAEVNMKSIDTGNNDRDNHLRTNDFFDIDTYPTMNLDSTGFEQKGDDEFLMHSVLTLRGVSKPVTFRLEFGGVGTDPWGKLRAGFTANATINRKDFGIEWNAPLESGGVLVGDKVQIELDVELVKADLTS